MEHKSAEEHTIYEQDCEFYRYQDGLMWGRIQTVATIEAGILYASYALKDLSKFDSIILFALVLLGCAVVVLVCGLAWKDEIDAEGHKTRIKEFEKNVEPFRPASTPTWLSGKRILRSAMACLIMANVLLALKVGWMALHTV